MIEQRLNLPSLELALKLTNTEANLLRRAMSKSVTAEESRKASKLLFKSLRERESRYTLRELP